MGETQYTRQQEYIARNRNDVYDFVRGIYDAAPESNKSIAIGYVQKNGKTILFSGDLILISF